MSSLSLFSVAFFSRFGHERTHRCGQGADRCSQTHPTLGTDEYIVDKDVFADTIIAFLNDEVPTTSAGIFASAASNYDMWGDQIRVRERDAKRLFCYFTW